MNKKKIFVLSVLYLIITENSKAQFYFNAGVGYSVPAFKQEVYSYGQSISNGPVLIENQSDNQIKEFRVSFNQGVHLRFGVGYSFSDLLGLELNADIQKPKEAEAQRTFGNQKNTYKVKGGVNSLTISPILNFSVGNPNISLFLKPGILLGTTEIHEEQVSSQNNFPIETKLTLDGGLVGGLNLSAGAAYSINRIFSLFGEVAATYMQYRPKNGNVDAYIANGQNNINTLPYSQFTLDDNYSIQQNQSVKARKSYSFSAIQLNIGVRISPWKNEGKARLRSVNNPFGR